MTLADIHEQAAETLKYIVLPIVVAIFTVIGTLYIMTQDMRIAIAQLESRQANGLARVAKLEDAAVEFRAVEQRQSSNSARLDKLEAFEVLSRDHISKDAVEHEGVRASSAQINKIERDLLGLEYRINAVEQRMRGNGR